MGAAALQLDWISPEDYLADELVSVEKHEYIDGKVYAMSGAADRHVKVTGNAYVALRQHLRGSGCSTYVVDMKVKVKAGKSQAFFYPDVLVTCDPADQDAEHDYYKEHPKLIIEVLSPSTEDHDRGTKFAYYRHLPSLQEYVLLDPRAHYAEVFRRQGASEWLLTLHEGAETMLTLHSIGLTCPLAVFYEDVTLA